MQWKNSLIKALIFLFKNRQRATRKESFLIVSTTGLGDTLFATPAIRNLRTSFPQSYIAVLTSRMGREVLKGNPHVDEFFTVSDSLISWILPFLKLRKRGIETAFLFHAS